MRRATWVGIALGAMLAGCGREPTGGNMAAMAVQEPSPAVATSPVVGPSSAAKAAPDAVLKTFLTRASAGEADALDQWRGSDAEGRAAMAAVRSYADSAIEVGAPRDPDAGAGQRYVTVPFTIAGTGGSAVLHKVADEIDSDDPSVHDWHVQSLTLPPRGGDTGAPATAEATYDCSPGGLVLMVRFDNRADTATTMVGGRTIRLAGQRPASGLWYAGDGYELRGKGRQARFALPDGTAQDCLAR